MTKTQFKKKIAGMKKGINQYIDKEALRLFDSGGVDTKNYEDGHLLPKVILNVTLHNLCDQQYRPLAGTEEDLANLKHF